MKLTILGSGSSGNGYVLQNDREALVLEAGMPIQDCLKAVQYNVRKIQACFITHEHGDHAKHFRKYLQYMPVWMSEGTLHALDNGPAMTELPLLTEALATVECGGFKVMAIPAQHDAAEPLAYIIEHEEIGKLLFATDTYYIEYLIPELNTIMLECNYDISLLNANVEKGLVHEALKKRTLTSHMSISNAIEMLKANDLSKLTKVILIHLSGQNSDPEAFCRAIEAETGKPTMVAKRGLTFEINKYPF